MRTTIEISYDGEYCNDDCPQMEIDHSRGRRFCVLCFSELDFCEETNKWCTKCSWLYIGKPIRFYNVVEKLQGLVVRHISCCEGLVETGFVRIDEEVIGYAPDRFYTEEFLENKLKELNYENNNRQCSSGV